MGNLDRESLLGFEREFYAIIHFSLKRENFYALADPRY